MPQWAKTSTRGVRGRTCAQRAAVCRSSLVMATIEVSEVRRRLVLAQRHQVAVGAAEVAFLADDDVVVGLGAEIFGPDRIVLAIVVAHHCPRTREGVVDGRDL